MAWTRPRRRLERVDAEGFTLVQRRRRRDTSPLSEPSAPDYRRYRLAAHGEETAYGALHRLHEAQPDLRVKLTVDGDEIYLTPKDEAAAFCLSRLAREGGEPGLNLKEVDRRTRCVVMRYPLSYSLIPLQEHPRVTFARRCVKRVGHGRIEHTRQVEVTMKGAVPESLDLGLWGVFPVRKYIPEPLRCFKCQAFGHVQKHCRRESELCGVCSQRHRTSECISALKAGDSREACCPNCGGRHHVWARHCPERARRLPPTERSGAGREQHDRHPPTQPESQPANPPTAPPATAPTAPGKKRKRRGKKRRKDTTPSEPPLPPTAEATTQTRRKKTRDAATNTEEEEGIAVPEGDGYFGEKYVVLTHDFFSKILCSMVVHTAQGMNKQEPFVRPDSVLYYTLGETANGKREIRIPRLEDLYMTEDLDDRDIFIFDPEMEYTLHF